MKILFADPVEPSRLRRLTDAGHECRIEPSLTADDLPAAMADTEVLVVRGTEVTSAAIDAAPALELIVRAGAGTDSIDVEAASAAGVYVSNVPGRNAIAVAELTFGLLLAVDRHIADGAADLRAGQWNKTRYRDADGLAGKTMTIIGLGEIGVAVAQRAKAFGMTVQAERKPDRSESVLQRIRSIGVRLVDDPAELLRTSDIVSIHVPKSPSTTGLVDDAFVDALPEGCILLNTSRGDVVDEAALLRGLDERGLRAGLDVFADEPTHGTGPFHSTVAAHPSVVGSHHIGASTRQAQDAVAEGVVDVLEAHGRGERRNCINLASSATGSVTLAVRHHDRVGVLAEVLGVLSANGHNVTQMNNRPFDGAHAAVATINVQREPSEATIAAMRDIDEVIAVAMTDLTSAS